MTVPTAQDGRYSYLLNTPAQSLQMVGEARGRVRPGPWHLVAGAYQFQGYLHAETAEFIPIGHVFSALHSQDPS